MSHSERRIFGDRGELDARALRHALSRFATGVCVVTALGADGDRLGMTANSFNSVSLDPPLVLFSIARSCLGFEGWISAKCYGINVLAAHQAEFSNQFAHALSDKWSGLKVETDHSGVPLLPDAIVRFVCECECRYDGGDHVILLSRVVAFDFATDADPLCFFAGRYRSLAPGPNISTPAEPALFYGW
jgi:flavin reductase (DIM6/NTAB) family NADH-FMN oxidoreductase RutF